MAWFSDLSPCTYFAHAAVLRAVGWLESGKEFQIGKVDRRVYDKLVELSREPWQPVTCAGLHSCDLCGYEPISHGVNNIFIPGKGLLYVCPELIVHYMNAHGYRPPAEFCDAVLVCPPMRSMEYLKAVLDNGGRALMKPSGT
jgi:hypothetical protein